MDPNALRLLAAGLAIGLGTLGPASESAFWDTERCRHWDETRGSRRHNDKHDFGHRLR